MRDNSWPEYLSHSSLLFAKTSSSHAYLRSSIHGILQESSLPHSNYHQLQTHDKFLDDESKILFILSYMQDGLAGVWAQNYMDHHTDGGRLRVGTYTDFSNELDQAFLDPNEDEFFIEFDRLLRDAGGRSDDSKIWMLKRALNPGLVRKINLNLNGPPATYQGWKETALDRDARYWHVRILRGMQQDGSSGKESSREGSVADREDTTDGGEHGHLARNCPNKR
ncbi:uncharacterized protein EV420DRAFT_1479973 [Desarmillaria tabescens]|uniref:DUF4939 domain-containing protein n=1 Tax=Armillaria tabescens TaxID=1929756 RepID=A0AA39KE53_ARMTA|nr:uncharacterized protein EV420DRAFT_1479973 [Desarmillaria tabescens]KAK0458231.1 hypothetical protein EV420DRAFT_1479973 [Desarmillaria tabescens]